ncbi:MAG: 30S ribosomal protein S6e [Desulfurococcales archaeon]|nr:30S ribosomal protein S6e [Desulfurococcales archaeon]
MSYMEKPPLRVVISDPKAGDRVVRVKVKGSDDPALELKPEMTKKKDQERSQLPIAFVGKKVYEELNLGEVGVMTIRFVKDDKKINIPFKVVQKDDLPDSEVYINIELIGEATGEMEAEADAFRAKAWQIAVPENVSITLSGLKIKDEFDGGLIGLPGKRLRVTGGTDATGIPMRPDIPGAARKRTLLSSPPGFHPKEEGERKRKLVRGNIIPDPRGERRKTALAQLNTVVVY